MGLVSQNVKSRIFHNGCESISHNIVQNHLCPNMNAMKKVNPCRIQRLAINEV
jgi:hypothetical protein